MIPLGSPAAGISVLFVAASLSAQAPSPLPDHIRFLQDTRIALQSDRQSQSRYTYREKRTETRLGGDGEVLARSVKVVDVNPAPPDGDATRRENEAIDEAFRIYDFRMIGRDRVDGYDAIHFTFSPAPGVTPRTSEGKLLQKFSGRAWIAERDHQLIRFEAESIDDVSMGLGLLARLYKGSRVVFQRRQLSDGVWLPSEFRYSGGGRVLLVKKLRIEGIREYLDYQPVFITASSARSGK
jgi:hypothetical protein